MSRVIEEGILHPERFFKDHGLTKHQVEKALEHCIRKVEENLELFKETFPDAASVNNVYSPVQNDYEWTQGFWTGMIWLAYEMTGNKKFREVAEIQVETFRKRIDERLGINHHDLGFLYTLSCVAAYKLTGNSEAKNIALKAADTLMERFSKKGEFIQAWGDLNAPDNYRLIIDCYLNLPLLFWASEVTGDQRFYDAAYKHAKTAMKVVVREDASTFHTYYFDSETGQPAKGVTAQGYSDDSCWARGQAWGVYGFPLSYLYTKDESFMEMYHKVTQYFLNRLPEDYIPYWDLMFTEGDQYRDSSAASIAICGLLEMDKWLPLDHPMKNIYQSTAMHILKSLIENYTTINHSESNGLLLHAVYSIPHNVGVDECNIWGDYYYMEALVRVLKDWELYW
ncbi:glycoside hydrolase family 88 protein [Neobacillus bataviensis]|uniref:glycoside hydrolase family 88 protein n=1 Tax=Neobacillus bataviensis TaxID=220685 RepID=UPI001CBA96BA|nr:glycoside hydrolase family 88 protein [Neobacillus bataviensis]